MGGGLKKESQRCSSSFLSAELKKECRRVGQSSRVCNVRRTCSYPFESRAKEKTYVRMKKTSAVRICQNFNVRPSRRSVYRTDNNCRTAVRIGLATVPSKNYRTVCRTVVAQCLLISIRRLLRPLLRLLVGIVDSLSRLHQIEVVHT